MTSSNSRGSWPRPNWRPARRPRRRRAAFPAEVFRTLGRAGLLGLPYPEEAGGGGQPYSVYLQVLEELRRRGSPSALGVSVHTLACFPLARYGSDEQKARWLPDLLGGELLGAYCLSEPHSGSDASALTTKAVRDGDDVRARRHQGVDHPRRPRRLLHRLRAHRPDKGPRGISCLHVPGDTAGVSAAAPEKKMGMRSSPTAQITFDDARIPADRLTRRGGAGLPDRAVRAGRRPSRHRGVRRRPRAGGAGHRGGVRGGAPRSSAARSPSSRACGSCSPTWRRASRPRGRST